MYFGLLTSSPPDIAHHFLRKCQPCLSCTSRQRVEKTVLTVFALDHFIIPVAKSIPDATLSSTRPLFQRPARGLISITTQSHKKAQTLTANRVHHPKPSHKFLKNNHLHITPRAPIRRQAGTGALDCVAANHATSAGGAPLTRATSPPSAIRTIHAPPKDSQKSPFRFRSSSGILLPCEWAGAKPFRVPSLPSRCGRVRGFSRTCVHVFLRRGLGVSA